MVIKDIQRYYNDGKNIKYIKYTNTMCTVKRVFKIYSTCFSKHIEIWTLQAKLDYG